MTSAARSRARWAARAITVAHSAMDLIRWNESAASPFATGWLDKEWWTERRKCATSCRDTLYTFVNQNAAQFRAAFLCSFRRLGKCAHRAVRTIDPNRHPNGGHAEPVIGRAFARPVGSAHP